MIFWRVYIAFMWGVEIIILFLLPFLMLKKKYRQSLAARFALLKNHIPHHIHSFDFWFHACSLGEVNSLKPLLEEINIHNQAYSILLSTTTQTGFKQAQKLKTEIFNNKIFCHVCYLPFEPLLYFWVRKTKKLFVMEAELWYGLFYYVKQKGGETILLNARISTHSYPKYLYLRNFYKILFKYVDKVFAQSEEDKSRLEHLGAKQIIVSGNIKALNVPKITYKFSPPSTPLVVLASTHRGEEQLLFESLCSYYSKLPFSLLVIPRHPERFEEVWKLINMYFGATHNLKKRSLDEGFLSGDVILGDSMGELVEFYAIASVVVLCGSFMPIGGHNPLEVAFFNKPLLSGKEIFNQNALFSLVDGYEIIESEALAQKLEQLSILKPTSIKRQIEKKDFFKLIF